MAPRWLRLCFMAGVVVGMFLFIWRLASEEEKKEATLMTVCWAQGQAHYPETAEQRDACPVGVQLLEWRKPTKTVRWAMDREFDGYKRSHRDAVAWVNKELGFEALKMDDSAIAPDITIEHGSYGEGRGLMSTKHRMAGEDITATILVKAPGDIREWLLEEEHELLHALGLAHDRRGIMSKTLDEGEGMKVWLLHEKDREALRALLIP